MNWAYLLVICLPWRRHNLIDDQGPKGQPDTSENEVRTAEGSSTSPSKWLAIGLVAAVVVTLVAAYPSLRSPSETSAGIERFRSVTQDFTVGYPDGWEKLSDSDLEKYPETFDFAVRRSDPRALLGVRVQTLAAAEAKLDEVAEVLEKALGRRFEKFEKISSATVEIGSGERALKYEYRFLAKGKAPVRQQMLIVPADEQVYYVTTWAGEKDYAKIAPELERMISTFRLN